MQRLRDDHERAGDGIAKVNRRVRGVHGGSEMTTAPTRFALGATAWIVIVAVLLVLLAAMLIYVG